jgi:signal transduction histidine kinase
VTLQESRFVVIAPVGRDGDLICTLLQACGYSAECVSSINEVDLTESTLISGLILTDEALTKDGFAALRSIIHGQPSWSDLPVILLTSGPSDPTFAPFATRIRLEFRSVFLLDRPVRKEMLTSAVQVAYNSRLKQLEVRDAADRQFRSDETLRNTEKLATAGKLAATLAHEINNPLEALHNLLFLVENSSTLDEAKSFSKSAVQELERIQEIVDLTLRLHRAPSTPSLNDVSEIAASALLLFRARLRARQIEEDAKLQSVAAYCSAGEIRQALVNLIGNAIDAMPDGGKLFLRVSPVSYDGQSYARLTVGDNGSGIPAEIRSNLFNQFFTTKGSRGTGLGLWLTQDIVQRNHGRLRFRSRATPPTGTVFSIYLPARPPAEASASDGSDPKQRQSSLEAA